jgi:hypothetical protein
VENLASSIKHRKKSNNQKERKQMPSSHLVKIQYMVILDRQHEMLAERWIRKYARRSNMTNVMLGKKNELITLIRKIASITNMTKHKPALIEYVLPGGVFIILIASENCKAGMILNQPSKMIRDVFKMVIRTIVGVLEGAGNIITSEIQRQIIGIMRKVNPRSMEYRASTNLKF